MTSLQIAARPPAEDETLRKIEQLLLRYPNVSAPEIVEIAEFLRDGTLMQIGLLSANHHAWESAEDIRRKHPHLFKATVKQKLMVAIALSTLVLVPISLWAIAP